MYKIINWLKEYCKDTNSVEYFAKQENLFLLNNIKLAEQNLKDTGWNILSIDKRVFYYGYTIQKNDCIVDISVRQALNIK